MPWRDKNQSDNTTKGHETIKGTFRRRVIPLLMGICEILCHYWSFCFDGQYFWIGWITVSPFRWNVLVEGS